MEDKNKTSFSESALLEEIKTIVLSRLSDTSFSTEDLSRLVGRSRMQLHRDIKKATGRSTSLFVRYIRLEKAKELLKDTDMTIGLIAYEVGFSYPSYFSLCFLKEYGMWPNVWREQEKS